MPANSMAPKKKAPRKNKPPEPPEHAIRRVMTRILAQKSRGPRFAVELTSSVQFQTKTTRPEVEAMLQQFLNEGAVIQRTQTHADPHLATADLRVVAPVDPLVEDGVAQAEAAVEALWAHWVGTWEAKHVCDAAQR